MGVYLSAPAGASVILCGISDVRDHTFNIKLESLRLGDFSQKEVRELYAQHTAETGQIFTEQALARAWELTRGQPRLVNVLAQEVVENVAVPASEPVTADHVEASKERLVLARVAHLNSEGLRA